MKALLSICLFWGLLSPGAPMSCHHCSGEDCKKPRIQECDADQDACASAVVETTQLNLLMPEYRMTFMQCSPASFCLNNYGSITTSDGGTSRLAVQCCYTDMCNNMTVSFPEPEDLTPNEMQCESCFAINSTGCQKTENISCTGGETKCFGAAAHISIDNWDEEFDIYFQGCATPNVCFVPLPDVRSSPDKVKIIFTERHCTDGVLNV